MKIMRALSLSFFIVFFLGLSYALAQDAADVITATNENISSAEAYWTPERMAEAKPMPWVENMASGAEIEDEPLGPPGSAPSGTGGSEYTSFALEEEPLAVSDLSGVVMREDQSDFIDYGTQDVFSRTWVNNWKNLWQRFPWRAIGKLFFVDSNGYNRYCSASVISPNNIIVTAAHCCKVQGAGLGGWSRSFVFVPAYRGGYPNIWGTFSYFRAQVDPDWPYAGAGRQDDVCVISLNPNSGGGVSSQVGWLGRSWNQSIVQHHHSLGYPQYILGGNNLVQCTSESYPNCGSSLVYGTGCDMTNGSSGGPWIRKFHYFISGANNYVNGVVSGWDSCTGTYGQSYNGPRFTTDNIGYLCDPVTGAGC